jgi:chromosome condensin MukBEF MukE localization factor
MDAQTPVKIDGLEYQQAGSDVLVHDPHQQKIHVLNESAYKLLQLCDGSPLDAIVDAMMPSEDFDRSRVLRDVQTAIRHFSELGLVRTAASMERTPQ